MLKDFGIVGYEENLTEKLEVELKVKI